MQTARSTIPADAEYLVSATLIVADIERSAAFYRDVLEATVLRAGEPTFLATSFGVRAAQTSSPNRKFTQAKSVATCAIRTATSSRSGNRRSPPALSMHTHHDVHRTADQAETGGAVR